MQDCPKSGECNSRSRSTSNDEDNNSSNNNSNMITIKRLKAFLKIIWLNITLEPVVALFVVSTGLIWVIRDNLVIDKACLQKLNYTAEVCENINEDQYDVQLTEVQKVVSEYEWTLALCTIIPRILYCLLAGAWSDVHGRKPLIAMSIFGQVLANLSYLFNYAFMTKLPFEMLYLEFAKELCGMPTAYYLAIYCYMADITNDNNKTTRLALLDGTDYFSTLLGMLISRPIFKYAGYYATFGTSGTLALLAFLYTIFVVKESLVKKEASEKESGGWSNCLPKPSYLISGFATVLKSRPGRKRMLIFMILFNMCCYTFQYVGTEGSHRYLWAIKKYGWDEQEFTLYLISYRLLYMVNLCVLVPVASKVFRFHEATIAIIACFMGGVGQMLPAFFEPHWVLYLGAVLMSLAPASIVTARTLETRCIDVDEIGKLFSLNSLILAIATSAVSAGYNAIYAATLNGFVGTFLLVNAFLLFITVPVNLFLRVKIEGPPEKEKN